MKIEDHLRNFRESLSVIKESIAIGIQERQRNIGFNVSVGVVDLLEAFLHQKQLLNPGSVIKHEWFSSPRRAGERINFDFPEKEKIISLICQIEDKRNMLCYGKPQTEELITKILTIFYELVDIFQKLGLIINSQEEK